MSLAHHHRSEVHPGHRPVTGGVIRAGVFGMSDGLISNVSLVIGFAGGGVDADVVRLGGLAGMIAGAVSMAAGEWISVSAQNEAAQREVSRERVELRRNKASEESELAHMYEAHGMEPATARRAAGEVMRSPREALRVHSREEFGVDPDVMPSPFSAAITSFLCFMVGAFLPVLPWFLGTGDAATWTSIAIGTVGAALLGWAIGYVGNRSRWLTLARQVVILLCACGVTYALGTLFDISVAG
jgi:VIT1/CCC1 family predicted Fe2+/Mn2+ transporter